jgi:hypothetical protein
LTFSHAAAFLLIYSTDLAEPWLLHTAARQ